MVRKQIYIHKRQDMLLKQLSQTRGVSESEIIRQAIEHEAANEDQQITATGISAWQKILALIEERNAHNTPAEPYRWNREEIYAERESRWLRDRDQD
jgi:Arc/MetJ-type ribon-helix-helix transcriptional regulator